MGATNYKRTTWLLLYVVFLLFQYFGSAANPNQASFAKNSFNHLLDSAEILKLKGFYDDAINICENVSEKSLKAYDWESYTRALVEHAEILRFSYYFSHDITEIDEALSLMAEAKNVLVNHLGQENMMWIRYHIYMGKLYKYTEPAEDGQPNSLLNYLNKAKEISLSFPTQFHELAKVNYELGNYYFNRNKMAEARPFIENLLDITLNHFPEFDYFGALYLEKTGSYFADVGDLERSVLCLENALYLYQNKQKDENNTKRTKLNLGNTYFYNRDFSDALKHYLAIIEDSDNSLSSSYNRLNLALLNTSTLFYEKGKLDSCIYFAEEASRLNNNQTKNDKLRYSFLMLNLGRATHNGAPSKHTADLFNKSIQTITEAIGEKSYEKHVIYRCIGESYDRANELDSALINYQRGLIALYETFDSTDIYTNPEFETYNNIEPVLYIILDKAKALYKRFLSTNNSNDIRASLVLYEKAYEIMRGLINDGFMNESIVVHFQWLKKDFQVSVKCAIQAYIEFEEVAYLEKAFQFIEQSKYFLLLKSLQSTLLKDRIGIADSLFLKERDISKDIEFLKHQLNQNEQIPLHQQYNIRNLILKNLLERDQIWQSIEKFKPKEYKNDFITLTEVKQNISGDKDILLEYYRSDSSFTLLVIGKQLNEIIQIPISPDLQNHIEEYSHSVSNNNTKFSKQRFNLFAHSSSQLFQKLLLPAFECVAKDGFHHASDYKYTIVPDGELSFLPFEAFTTHMADTSELSYWSLPYVCREYVINYAFSLNVLNTRLVNENKGTKSNILAMSYSSNGAAPKTESQSPNKNEIPYSAMEVSSINKYFKNADFFKYEHASESQFKEMASDFALIHLAIHGMADSINRFNSKLIFGPETGDKDDGELYAYELYNLDLSNTQLAVLSACETGLGKQVEGEGIFSMARGFAFAGCPSVVMSLWRANDKSTYVLMNYFYENLASGMQKDRALQVAKIKFINEMDDYDAHPSNWATFIALGNNDPVQLKNGSFPNFIIYGITLILIISAILYTKKKSMK